MKSKVHVMALTATATQTLRRQVECSLGMIDPVKIVQSPDKVNIRFASVQIKSNYELVLKLVLKELKSKRTSLPRIIIFCKYKSDCSKLYTYFQVNMGCDFTEHHKISQNVAWLICFSRGLIPLSRIKLLNILHNLRPSELSLLPQPLAWVWIALMLD